MAMTFEIITSRYNEEFLAPFFLNHYSYISRRNLSKAGASEVGRMGPHMGADEHGILAGRSEVTAGTPRWIQILQRSLY
jgi:hypothetical protein